MIPASLSPLGNHLWQSTVCAAVAWLLVFKLKKNRAAVRYWIWLAASLKFLVPFSLLMSLGTRLAWSTASGIARPAFSFVAKQIGQPFSIPAQQFPIAAVLPVSGSAPVLLFLVWFCGFAISVLLWLRSWRRIRRAACSATPLPLNLPIPAMSSNVRLEPGIAGIRKPILLLPEGVTDHLTVAQFEAVIAHELCHFRRRDNLTAALHMIVEVIFWFYPLVWWIRGRLIEERERACDEEVLRGGGEPQAYAEGILNVCRFYLESPSFGMSGVTGSDLKRRIQEIVSRRIAHDLDLGRKLILAAAGTVLVACPVVIGILNAPPARAQAEIVSPHKPTFEVATVKPNRSGDTYWQGTPFKGPRYTARNATLRNLISAAYGYPEARIPGGPAWMDSNRYDIEAKVEGQPDRHGFALMFQSLLEDRFQLRVHTETRESSLYALVVARSGLKLGPHLAQADNRTCSEGAPPVPGCGGFRFGPAGLTVEYTRFGILANALTRMVGRSVVDETGLNGRYDLKLEVMPTPDEPLADSIINALREQAGLQLQSRKNPVEVLVIDSASKPGEN